MNREIIFILVILLNYFGFSQCTNIASGFGNNTPIPMYNISGNNPVSIILNSNQTITFSSNASFSTASGPDVRVFLVNPGSLTNTQLKSSNPGNLPNSNFGIISSNNSNPNGIHTFTSAIPAEINISNYTKVFFYCVQFNQFWDFGTIAAFSGSNCNLATENFKSSIISDYSNPASEIIQITSEVDWTNYLVYDNSEKIIISEKLGLEWNKKINIKSLTKGLNFLELNKSTNEKAITKFLKN
jgi:hypothetical protein